MAVASHLKQPTRTSVQDRTCCKRQRMSLHGLAPDGVYHARSVTSSAVRSYRTFSPLPAYPFPASGGLFSVALSLELPPPGVTRHPDPVEPGLSSPFEKQKQQPSGHLTACIICWRYQRGQVSALASIYGVSVSAIASAFSAAVNQASSFSALSVCKAAS